MASCRPPAGNLAPARPGVGRYEIPTDKSDRHRFRQKAKSSAFDGEDFLKDQGTSPRIDPDGKQNDQRVKKGIR